MHGKAAPGSGKHCLAGGCIASPHVHACMYAYALACACSQDAAELCCRGPARACCGRPQPRAQHVAFQGWGIVHQVRSVRGLLGAPRENRGQGVEGGVPRRSRSRCGRRFGSGLGRCLRQGPSGSTTTRAGSHAAAVYVVGRAGAKLRCAVYSLQCAAVWPCGVCRWCGLLINSSSLEVQADYSRYCGHHVRTTLSVPLGNRPGAAPRGAAQRSGMLVGAGAAAGAGGGQATHQEVHVLQGCTVVSCSAINRWQFFLLA